MTKKKNIQKIGLYQLVFEITRMCNMNCAHCLRGEAEKLRMRKAYIDRTLKSVSCIHNLVITGGEPTLAVDLIQYIYFKCLEYGIEVQNVWAATNGKIRSRKFLEVMTEFIEYSKEFDGEISGIALSTDQFHSTLPEENYWFYTDYQYYDDCKTVGVLKNTIPEGRAKENILPTNNYSRILKDEIPQVYIANDGALVVDEGVIYVNAKGDILFNCDYSFETQEECKRGNIMDGENALLDCILKHAEFENEEDAVVCAV